MKNRKQRRSILAAAERKFGLKGDAALKVNDAYRAIQNSDVQTALVTAAELSESHPENPHAWLIFGHVANMRREADTALKFYQQAVDVAPKRPEGYAGIAKSLVLQANVDQAVTYFEMAFELGSVDVSAATLYAEVKKMMGDIKSTADVLMAMAQKNFSGQKASSASIFLKAGDFYAAAEFYREAAEAYFLAYERCEDKNETEYKIGRLKGLMFSQEYDEADVLARQMSSDGIEEAIVIYAQVLRTLGEHAQAIDLLEASDFDNDNTYQISLGVFANLQQDLGDYDEAEDLYREAVFVQESGGEAVKKAFGAFQYYMGEFEDGFEFYAQRQPAKNRKLIPADNAGEENIEKLSRAFLMQEQGVGDQVALLGMASKILKDKGVDDIFFIGENRFEDLLSGNTMGIKYLSKDAFDKGDHDIQANELMFVGDLSQYLTGESFDGQFDLLKPSEKVAGMREKYCAMKKSEDAQVIGVSWRSAGSLSGYMRSIALGRILDRVPAGSVIVPMQYDTDYKEMKKQKKRFPDLVIMEKPDVNQMASLADLRDQIAACDRVITIDNTTAHIAGATLSDVKVDLLLPQGAECMWYWGKPEEDEDLDRWYGRMKVHRQRIAGEWSDPLKTL